MSREQLAELVERTLDATTSTLFPDYPLLFASHEDVLGEASEFAVTESFLAVLGLADIEADWSAAFPTRVGFALCDIDGFLETYPDESIDAESEFFLVWDAATDAVELWTGAEDLAPVASSLEAFLRSLGPWGE